MEWIRIWNIGDAQDIAKAMNNKKVQDNLRDGIPYPYTESDARQYIQSALEAPKDSQYHFAIQCDGKAVGSLALFRKENVHYRTAELGYYLAEEYWGRGIMPKAVREACQYMFENTNIVRIFAEPFAPNAASCRVLEKSGFTLEGVLRKNCEKNGQMMDNKLYAITR